MRSIIILFLLSFQLLKGQTITINRDDLYVPQMQDSLPDGNYIYVYKNLNFSFLTGEYKMHRPDGVWHYFTKDSIIENVIVFNQGIPVVYIDYYEGSIIEEKIFKSVEIKGKIKYWCPTIPDYVMEKPIFMSSENSDYTLTSNNFTPEIKLIISYSKGKIVSIERK